MVIFFLNNKLMKKFNLKEIVSIILFVDLLKNGIMNVI